MAGDLQPRCALRLTFFHRRDDNAALLPPDLSFTIRPAEQHRVVPPAFPAPANASILPLSRARVGLGPRHLRRLFVEHLGASPMRIGITRRVHFARNLIEGTDLPITKLAAHTGHDAPQSPIQTSRNRYPMCESVKRYLGWAASSSSFLRNWRMKVRRYSSSLPYSGPHTAPRIRACIIGSPACFIR